MRLFVLTLVVLLCVAIIPARMAAASDGVSVAYIGGTLPSVSKKTDGKIGITSGEFFQFRAKCVDLKIGYDKINLLEYGQKADRRYAMAFLVSPVFLLSKSRQHFLTVGYTDENGKQQAMIFRVGKGDVRPVLVSLEARTGLKVEFQDGEARKAGKG